MKRRRKMSKGRWMKLRSSEVLRAFMKQKGFSMQRLATYSGCSKSFIGFLANGDKKSCTEKLAKDIARALDVPCEVLFEHMASAACGRNDKPARRVA